MLAVLTTLTPALNLGPRLFRPTRSSMVRMQEEVMIAPPKSVVDAVIDSTTNEAPQAQTRFTAVNLNSLDKWAENPLMTRKAGKTYLPEEFEEDNAKSLAVRYQEIESGGKEIAKLLLAKLEGRGELAPRLHTHTWHSSLTVTHMHMHIHMHIVVVVVDAILPHEKTGINM